MISTRRTPRLALYAPALVALLGSLPLVGHTAAPPAPTATAASSPASAPAQRIATDTAVREGMLAIRVLMAAQEARIAARTLSADDYRSLARAIEAQMNARLAQRALPKAAAVAFQGGVWQDLSYCVGLMGEGRTVDLQRTGALGVQQVLRNYAQYFDHPGW